VQKPLSKEPPEIIRGPFFQTQYFQKFQLVTWHPRGVLDDAFADQIVEFVEKEERLRRTTFDRYTDLSGLTEVRLKIDHFSDVGMRRRKASRTAKSAFFADKPVSLFIARLYEMLMGKAAIKVRVFRKRSAAAKWLGVPMKVLEPPP
jgi:hypothetical protein